MTAPTGLFVPRTPGRPKRPPRPAWHPHAPPQTRFQESLHEPHWDARASIIHALADAPAPRLQRQANRLATCGTGASFFLDAQVDHVRPWLSRCKDRLCPFCAKARSASVTEGLEDLMRNHACDRMIILTLRAIDLPLADCLAQLKRFFKTLRRSKTWKHYVTGGAYVIEITLNPRTGLWHPHLHVAYRGLYFPQRLLSITWKTITSDSDVVWVSKVHDLEGASREMAKYVGKPQRIDTFTPDQIREYASATHGLRMVQTFGDCHNKPLTDDDPGQDEKTPDRHVPLSDLIHLTRCGFQTPAHLLALVAQRWAVFGRYINHELPQLAPHTDRTNSHDALLRLLRAEGPEQTRSPPPAAVGHRLDKQIRMAFLAYLTENDQGLFADTPMYYNTRTETLDWNHYHDKPH